MTEDSKLKLALVVLDLETVSSKTLAALLQDRYPEDFSSDVASAIIEQLQIKRYVVRINGKLSITQAGKELASLIGQRAEPPRLDKLKGDFYAPELGRTCLRPGAYDFMDKPSLVAGKPVPYRYSS